MKRQAIAIDTSDFWGTTKDRVLNFSKITFYNGEHHVKGKWADDSKSKVDLPWILFEEIIPDEFDDLIEKLQIINIWLDNGHISISSYDDLIKDIYTDFKLWNMMESYDRPRNIRDPF